MTGEARPESGSAPKEDPASGRRFGVRLKGLLLAGGTVVCIATLLGFLGRFNWFADLFSHFQVQYLATLLPLGVWAWTTRRRGAGVAFLGFAALNLAFILPLYVGGANPASPDAGPVFRAMLINVNSHSGNPERVARAIRSANPDILVLEEISDTWVSALDPVIRSYPQVLLEPRDDNFGIGLFSRFPLSNARMVSIGRAGVPSILATLHTDAGDLQLVATHPLPPAGREYSRLRNEQLEQLPEFTRSPLPVLLMGDLNVTPWNYYFRRLLNRSGLKNSMQGFGVQTSWPTANGLLRIPLDHALHSSGLSIVNRTIGPKVGSDHFPVWIDFILRK